MLKRIIIVFFLVLGTQLHAQKYTSSPYSYVGFGEMLSSTTVENQAMGKMSIYTDSIHLNLNNPAALGKLKVTNYAIGLSSSYSSLASDSQKSDNLASRLEYIGVSFPLAKKLGFSFGVMPFTAMDYRLYAESSDSDGTQLDNIFSGNGNINKLYFSLGKKLFKYLDVGASMYANFGTITKERIQSIPEVFNGTIDRRTSRLRGVNYNLSAHLQLPLTEKIDLYASAIHTSVNELSSENLKEIGTVNLENGTDIEVNSVDLSLTGLDQTSLVLPARNSIGVGFGTDKSWFFGAQYTSSDLSNLENDFLSQANVSYQKSSLMSVGGFFIPNASNFASYFQRSVYRAGIHLSNTGYVINNQEIKDFGVNFGVGLPVGGVLSNLNATLSLGTRGTKESGLIKENYVKLKIGLSLNDIWFAKRQIN